MRLISTIVQIALFISCIAFFPTDKKGDSRELSGIEVFARRFSKQHKTWTQDNISVVNINRLFADSLSNFYNLHRDAFDNLELRLENVLDSGNGRVASFECWGHYVDNKQLRAHVYAYVPDTIKRLFNGNDYIITGRIEKFDVYHGAGYNPIDNSCDVGIVTVKTEKMTHLKGHNKTGEQGF